ncbi:MAG: transcriptional repressor [Cyanobacteria bacterium J06642_2]
MTSSSHFTRAQKAVLSVLERRSSPLSAQGIFIELRESERPIGLASVYRALEFLKNEGQLQQIDLGDNQAYYQMLPSDGHSRHHLICTNCRKVLPLPSCPVEALEQQLSKQYDFTIERHVLTFYGICLECRA